MPDLISLPALNLPLHLLPASLPVLLVIVLFCGYLDYLALVSYCLYG